MSDYLRAIGGANGNAIFRLFLEHRRLKFSEIEKLTELRSNKLAYYLKGMQKENILRKKGEHYRLTGEAEKYLPLFSSRGREPITTLPIVMVAIVRKGDMLLIKRRKRPFKDYWCMIGGKMLFGETFEQATRRLAMGKASIRGRFVSLNAIMHERIHENREIKHSFMLFFTKMAARSAEFKQTPSGELKWFSLERIRRMKRRIVPSDYWLITNRLDSSEEVRRIDMRDKGGRLVQR
ncbi:GDP-mannose mannosyl hydrolase [uncultured archaeon]|nr:GDP-mannose mannosyl hydrolase [uncultured archaeon]